MPCHRCGAELNKNDILCLRCGARILRPARVPGAVAADGRYSVRRRASRPAIRLRARQGFALPADVLPKRPPATTSAAAPIQTPVRARPSAAPRPRPDLPPPAPPRPAESSKPAPASARPLEPPRPSQPPRPLREPRRVATRTAPVTTSAPPRTPPRPSPRAERQPVRNSVRERAAEPPNTGWIGTLVIAGLALGMAGAWWSSRPATHVGPAPEPALQTEPPVATAPAAPLQAAPSSKARPAAYHPPVRRAAPVAEAVPPPELETRAADAVKAAEPPAADHQAGDRTAGANAAEEDDAADAKLKTAEATEEIAEPEQPARATARQAPRKRVPPPVAKKERNEEIDRLRTQAFSETRQERLERINRPREAGKVPISAGGNAGGSLRAAFARCDRSGNILKREQCRWRVCGDKWGRHGCPSYRTENRSLAGPA